MQRFGIRAAFAPPVPLFVKSKSLRRSFALFFCDLFASDVAFLFQHLVDATGVTPEVGSDVMLKSPSPMLQPNINCIIKRQAIRLVVVVRVLCSNASPRCR